PGTYAVEADASSASYFIAAGAIAASPEQPLVIEGVGSTSIQGDIRFVEAARLMGAHVQTLPDRLVVHRGSWPLKAITLNCNHIPDAAMTLAIMAMYAQGTTRLTHIASWRVKETDRINAMRDELIKLGAHVNTGEDFIEITPPANHQWQTKPIKTYDDHRMAMCFSLAAFNPTNLPIRLLDPACVNKTYPTYFHDFFQVVHTDTASIPVITLDGPTASGKGTLASQLAQILGYHYLDSGLLYRITALAAIEENILDTDEQALAQLASSLSVIFKEDGVWYKGDEISQQVRAEKVGMMASKIAAYPLVRESLGYLQQSFRQLPGLIADGRDMGTVIFKDAQLKIFLTADAYARAKRRYKQLIEKGISANIDSLYADLQARDERDMNRSVAPLKPAEDAHLLDNSNLSIEESVEKVLFWWESIQKLKS
ncbi:MAG: (d)CMP kinase, partial [Saezia sp.]